MAQPKSQLPLLLGLTAAGGVGYYLYNAGGSPKAAEKQFEADVHKASAKVKSELPGRADQAKSQAESYANQASSKLESTTEKARSDLAAAQSKLSAQAADAKKETMKKIDQFDAKVTEEAGKAKSGISSWFGGK